MSPSFTTLNAPNIVLSDAIAFGNVGLRTTGQPDLLDLFMGELVSPIALTGNRTILGRHISHVNRSIANEQMVGVAARRVIASVQNQTPLGQKTLMQNPCDSVRLKLRASNGDPAILMTFVVASTLPNMATGNSVYRQPRRESFAYSWKVGAQKNIVEIHQAAPWLGARAGSSVATTLPPAFSNNPAALTQAA